MAAAAPRLSGTRPQRRSEGCAGSAPSPVSGSTWGIGGAARGLCLGQAAVTPFGYCWCVKAHVCLSCVAWIKAAAKGNFRGKKSQKIGARGSSISKPLRALTT